MTCRQTGRRRRFICEAPQMRGPAHPCGEGRSVWLTDHFAHSAGGSFCRDMRNSGGFCPVAKSPIFSKALIPLCFASWHGGCKSPDSRALGRACGAARQGRPREGGLRRATRGVTDAEYSSGRAVTSGRDRARARRGRQQHRQYRYHRLQGRRLVVRGVSVLIGPLRGQFGPHQLRARPRRLARYEPGCGRAHRQSARCRDRAARAS